MAVINMKRTASITTSPQSVQHYQSCTYVNGMYILSPGVRGGTISNYYKHILEFLNVKVSYPMMVRVDNVGTMFLANNPALSQRTKHISVRQHFIREHVENGLIKIIFVKSKFNTADIFTKNLSQELFIRHSTNLMNRMIESKDDVTNEATHEK